MEVKFDEGDGEMRRYSCSDRMCGADDCVTCRGIMIAPECRICGASCEDDEDDICNECVCGDKMTQEELEAEINK